MPSESHFEQLLNFDIDRYLNPYIPHNRLYIFPKPISRWLGYRFEPTKEPYTVLQWPITILATIAGLCLVSGIGNYAPGVLALHPPVIIASFGASAILEFNTIKSPLAQPRNAIIGNTLAAICGVAIAKLFQLNPAFGEIEWVSGAVGCALASWVMSLTNTIHPPGGATAILASTDASVIALGWWYPSIVLLDSVLVVAVACIFNNVTRQYPMYWWTPHNVGRKLRQERREEKGKQQEEKKAEEGKAEEGMAVQKSTSDSSDSWSSSRTLRRELSNRVDYIDGLENVHIEPYHIQLPHHVRLSDDEIMLLVKVQERIRTHGEVG
ncbi:related to HPP family [Lecanosticta acicola]|uniref:Related to HPP family n=1 Tax=Lecanosticta acicola TaxID=111012 RepID=A0AAI8YSU3_9PEZI|nr:related to HPP family [Lecanosticta acicola]